MRGPVLLDLLILLGLLAVLSASRSSASFDLVCTFAADGSVTVAPVDPADHSANEFLSNGTLLLSAGDRVEFSMDLKTEVVVKYLRATYRGKWMDKKKVKRKKKFLFFTVGEEEVLEDDPKDEERPPIPPDPIKVMLGSELRPSVSFEYEGKTPEERAPVTVELATALNPFTLGRSCALTVLPFRDAQYSCVPVAGLPTERPAPPYQDEAEWFNKHATVPNGGQVYGQQIFRSVGDFRKVRIALHVARP